MMTDVTLCESRPVTHPTLAFAVTNGVIFNEIPYFPVTLQLRP